MVMLVLLAVSLLPLAALTAVPKADDSAAANAMRVLQANCLSCHNAEKHKGGLNLLSRESALKGGDSGAALVPSEAGKSLLFQVVQPDSDPHMPPKKQLSAAQISTLQEWLAAGARWDTAALASAAAPRRVALETLSSNHRPVLALALSPDGKRLAAGRGNQLVIYETAGTNKTPVASVEAHADLVRSVAWSPDGKWLASGSFREIKAWSAEKLEKAWQVSSNILDRVTVVRFSPHGGAVIAADGAAPESWVRLFDAATGKPLGAWAAHEDTVYDMSVSPEGGLLATAGADRLVKIWELVSQKEAARIEAHMGYVFGVAFNTNATALVTGGADNQLKVWDARTRQSVVTIPGRKHSFNSLAWSANGKLVAAADDDGRVWSFSDFKSHTGEQSSATAQQKELRRIPSAVHAVAVSGDGSRIAAGGEDGNVYLMEEGGKLLAELKPESKSAAPDKAVSFVHDVLPVLAKAGCMAGSCHAKPEGQNGFKLSVFSYDPKSDYEEIVMEGRGRRVFPASPAESLVLLKPTMQVEHGGGQRFEVGSAPYQLLLKWIQGGMIYQRTNEPALARISVEPRERSYKKGESQSLRVTAHYSDGSTRDVTALSDFAANDKEMASVAEEGQIKTGALNGETVIVARFMGIVDTARVTIPAEQVFKADRYAALPARSFVDKLAYQHFQKLGLLPSEPCSDAEFFRRASLDTIGVLPSAQEAREFLASRDPDKRQRWIERLLAHPAYADYWANKWADLLRPNPDRVGVKSVYVLDQWLRDAFRANLPYDEFARAIVTAEGSNHRFGPAVVYRDRRDPPELTTMFSQLFLGVRMECAKCHHHPNEKWGQEDFYQLAAYFGPVKQKGAGLSPPISAGTETFYFVSGGAVRHPVTGEVMKARPLDGAVSPAPAEADPRDELADWMTNSKNPFFAKAAVNRVWAVFFGRGFVNPVDDFRVSNPAVNEPLLDALAEDFAAHGYDLKHLMRRILESNLYQLSSAPNAVNLADTKNFSRSYRRRLPAETLLDAVNEATGFSDEFQGLPPGARAMQTWTYKISSPFLDAFGRPNSSSDCPCERDLRSSVVQGLHMMNATGLQTKLSHAEGRAKKLAGSKLSPPEIITELYLAAYSRFPTEDELAKAAAPFSAPDANRQTATEDVLWALLNSPEFIFNH